MTLMQTIDTAPRDGRQFIAWVDDLPYRAFYDERGRFVRTTHENLEGRGRIWRLKTDDAGREWQTLEAPGEPARYEKAQILWSNGFNFKPTHWSELPVKPVTPAKETPPHTCQYTDNPNGPGVICKTCEFVIPF